MWWVLLHLICWYSSNVCSLQQVQNINFVALGPGFILHPALQVSFDPFCALVPLLNPNTEADDYTLNGDSSCKYRVLLVSRVVVGNPHKRRQNATNMIEPPCGYHSVGLLMLLLSSFNAKIPRSLANLEWTSITKRQLYTTMTRYDLRFSLYTGILLRNWGPSCDPWH
jgi:hypothetical protein